jgi:acetyl coenzyme A synthetase (ADP forming)-like protein
VDGKSWDARDVILRDGTTMRLHPPLSGEEEAVLELFSRLTTASLHSRFHGLPPVGPALVAPYLDPDGVERGALVGTLADGGGERVVALASWTRLRDPSVAEVAFAVEDGLQGKGVGTRLLEQLADSAARAGVEQFVAEVLPDNRSMLRVFADAGFELTRTLSGGTVEVRFSIEPTDAYREHVDQRDHEAVVASLRPFFAPTSVAVVGASPRECSIGGTVFRNVLECGFVGRVYPVNLSGQPVAGVPSARSVAELPEKPDLAVICVPAANALDAAEDALESGAEALCVISAGFAEVGDEGAERQERLLALVRAHGARLLGPNCLGLSVAGCRLNATFARSGFPAGPIGFASQSGALGLALLEAAAARGLGFSSFVSVGNKADVSSNDLLEHWQEDDSTRLVLLYMESFGNPRKFARVARRVARRKPVLAVKSGHTRAGARAARSHTAALVSSDTAVEALFRQAGVTRAASLEELLDVATLYASGPAPGGRCVGVVTNAGGLGILCADACEAGGLELPTLSAATTAALGQVLPREASLANPVDMLGSASAATYGTVLSLLLADETVDAVIVLFVPAASVSAQEVATAVVGAAADATRRKPVLAALLSADGIPQALRAPGSGIAAFTYPESAARALARAAERAEWLRRPAGRHPALDDIRRDEAEAIVSSALSGSPDVWLPPDDVRRLLAAYGIPFVAERTARSVAEAREAARELGFPVAVKSAVPGAHKSDSAGVVLGLATEDEVEEAAAGLGLPVVVQAMVSGNAELLAGLVQDPVFGPLVAFGPGGTLTALMGQASFAVAPLTDVDAVELVGSGNAGRLVRGVRGASPSDEAALADLVLRLSRVGEDFPEVAELDLNPVIGLSKGCIAVDARLRLIHTEPRRSAKTW